MSTSKCFLCDMAVQEISEHGPLGDFWVVKCNFCGPYAVTGSTAHVLSARDSHVRLKIASFVKERQLSGNKPPYLFTEHSLIPEGTADYAIGIDVTESFFPSSISERLDRTLLNFYRSSKFLGDSIQITPYDLAIAYAFNDKEVEFTIAQLLKDGYLECPQSPAKLVVTVKGINRIAEFERGTAWKENRQAFVAMWFDSSTNNAYINGIKPAIEQDCNFKALRIDLKEHNNQITDEIISGIRASRFLVADVTGHRQGVYYEAGFMHALGRPVIFTCLKEHLSQAHFDTRQYSHISWENPEELRVKLKNRIKATIPD